MIFKESEILELKKSTAELKEAVISIGAILNKHKKGELYFGIKNDGEVVGQDVSEKTLREVSQVISDKIEPKLYPEIKPENIDGKHCIKVSFEGHEQPYFAYGRAYIRVADEDKQLSAKELENFIRRKTAIHYDSKVSESTLDEVDEGILREFIQKANESQRIKFTYTNKKDVLEKLNLIKDSKLLHAAKLLFSKKDPIEVQAAVFAGIDKITFLDIKQFKGNIFQLLKMSESYIKEHMDWRANLTGAGREEIPEIPIRAIIEALVNSFCHRDYQAPESNKVAIYKDRVEIWNPGDFPEGYKPRDFIKKDLPSILRNPIIANMLYLSSDIEKWGSGLKRINNECVTHAVKVDFVVLKYGFTVRFARVKRDTVKVPEKVTVKVPEKVTVNQTAILSALSKDPHITAKKLSALVGISERKIKENLSKLKEKGLIKRIGPDKGGHWEVIQP